MKIDEMLTELQRLSVEAYRKLQRLAPVDEYVIKAEKIEQQILSRYARYEKALKNIVKPRTGAHTSEVVQEIMTAEGITTERLIDIMYDERTMSIACIAAMKKAAKYAATRDDQNQSMSAGSEPAGQPAAQEPPRGPVSATGMGPESDEYQTKVAEFISHLYNRNALNSPHKQDIVWTSGPNKRLGAPASPRV